MSVGIQALAIAGMHRSGTSLLASWLSSCGLFLGRDLFGPSYGNPRGHFEDKRFISLQQSWLEEDGVRFTVPSDFIPGMTADRKRQAEQLVIDCQQEGYGAWGWKDPRTTLFLPLWKSVIPDIKVIAIYRDWRQVVASLMRRDRKQPAGVLKSLAIPLWHQLQNRPLANSYLETWIAYNRILLNFLKESNGILVSPSVLISSGQEVIDQLNRLGVQLQYQPFTEVYHPVDWHDDAVEPSVSESLRASADAILEQLARIEFTGKAQNPES